VFVRDKVPASASVFVTLAPGRVLGEAQVRAIVWLVSSSVAGLAAEKVSVVDQSGALLSAGSSDGEAAQLGYQVKVEAMVRDRLFKLLTPLIGSGRFTAEVAADVDFSQNETSSERFARDGVLRSEAASRALEANAPPARGIPGALSNTAPAAAQLTATPPAAAAPPVPPAAVTSETTNRAWEIGKDVSVTRGAAPKLRRLSVAVVIDKGDVKMSPQDLAGLTRIVRGAIGYDPARGDIVEVQLRRFAVPVPEPESPWYAAPALENNLPGLVLAVLAAVGGGGYVLLGRRRSRSVAVPSALAIDGGELAPAAAATARLVDYSEKLGTTRGLVDTDADRATAVARQMLATSA
jgi:flagellar M-ring protein FliF